MTTLHDEKKGALNVTLVSCGGKISLVRNKENDGYAAIQVEIAKTKNKTVKKEFRTEGTELKKGDEIKTDIFEIGDIVNVSGIAKAKGFQGVVKRHGFKGAPKTHGHKHDLRAPGSIGSGFPEHVTKGRKMAGRMGGKRSSSRNIEVAYVDKENNILGLLGPVPGIPGTIVEIRSK